MKTNADMIFVGKVTTVVGHGPLSIEATFVPDKFWKGSLERELKVRTSGACRVNFEEGGTYLVYSQRDSDGRFVTDVCLGTAIKDLRTLDIKRLGKPIATLDSDKRGTLERHLDSVGEKCVSRHSSVGML